MRKLILYTTAFLFQLVTIPFCFAQTQSNVTTPKGSSVRAYIVSEMDYALRVWYDNDTNTSDRDLLYTYSNPSSSQKYNCHGYAWNMIEGGPMRWIGYSVTTDEDVYMTDGSYIQVCSETYPGKVSWGSNDHSAVTTSTPGRWRSKWGPGPLLEHNWNDTPYGTTNLRYYVSTKINGPSAVCSSITSNVSFSAATFSGATYTWTKSSNIILTGSGSAVLAKKASSSASGSGWVQVVINSPCGGSVTTRKYVTVGASITMSWSGTGPYGQVDVTVSGGSSPYKFYRNNSLIHTSYSNPTTVPFGCNGGTLKVEASTPCGTASASAIIPSGCAPPPHMVVYPNPTSSEIYVAESPELGTNASGEARESYPDTEDIYLELYDFNANNVRNKSFSGKREEWKMDVSDLKKGTYLLRIVGKEVDETHQIVVTE